MKKLLYIAGTTVVILALSCGKGGEEAPPDPMPLAVGNWWLFQDITDTTDWFKDSIVAQEAFGSHPEAYKAIETGPGRLFSRLAKLPYEDTLWFFYDGDYFTLGLIVPFPTEDTAEIKYFKKNPAIGDTWFTRFLSVADLEPDGTPDTMIMRFNGSIVEQVDVTVPAGTFNDAYKAFYTTLDSTWISSVGSWQVEQDTMGWIYWALGTGVVKSTDYPDEATGSQLKDYEVK